MFALPSGGDFLSEVEMEKRTEETRIRINYKISAKGLFQPDITSEAETVETAISNLDNAKNSLDDWAKAQGYQVEDKS